MRYLLSFFLCLSSYILFAEPRDSLIDVSATEGLPSSLVNGVSVISGDYTMAQTDLVLPGPESLVFQRHYSTHTPGGQFGLGWGINHDEEVMIERCWISTAKKNEVPTWELSLIQSSGTHLTYEHDKKCKDVEGEDSDQDLIEDHKEVVFDLELPLGLTNGAHVLSGRTNLNNYKVTYYGKKNKYVEVKLALEIKKYLTTFANIAM